MGNIGVLTDVVGFGGGDRGRSEGWDFGLGRVWSMRRWPALWRRTGRRERFPPRGPVDATGAPSVSAISLSPGAARRRPLQRSDNAGTAVRFAPRAPIDRPIDSFHPQPRLTTATMVNPPQTNTGNSNGSSSSSGGSSGGRKRTLQQLSGAAGAAADDNISAASLLPCVGSSSSLIPRESDVGPAEPFALAVGEAGEEQGADVEDEEGTCVHSVFVWMSVVHVRALGWIQYHRYARLTTHRPPMPQTPPTTSPCWTAAGAPL